MHKVVLNMRDEFREATVDIFVKLPRAHEYIRRRITIGESLAEYFCPLPRDREIMTDSAIEAAKQAHHRRQIAHDIAKVLAADILDAIESRDPIQGYSPEEWAQINRKAPRQS